MSFHAWLKRTASYTYVTIGRCTFHFWQDNLIGFEDGMRLIVCENVWESAAAGRYINRLMKDHGEMKSPGTFARFYYLFLKRHGLIL